MVRCKVPQFLAVLFFHLVVFQATIFSSQKIRCVFSLFLAEPSKAVREKKDGSPTYDFCFALLKLLCCTPLDSLEKEEKILGYKVCKRGFFSALLFSATFFLPLERERYRAQCRVTIIYRHSSLLLSSL